MISSSMKLESMPFRAKSYSILPQGELEPLTSRKQYRRWNFRFLWQWAIPFLLAAIVVGALAFTHVTKQKNDKISAPDGPACPQYPALETLSEDRKKLEGEVNQELSSDAFFNKSLEKMQGAVKIATESFDDMGEIGEDKRWDVFFGFHEYLKKTFPLVYVVSTTERKQLLMMRKILEA